MKELNFHTEKETITEQVQAGRFNPALVLLFRFSKKDYRITIGAGYDDEISLFVDTPSAGSLPPPEFYLLTRNVQLGYIGLDVYNAAGEQIADVFLDADGYLPAYDDMPERRCVQDLLEYVY